MNTSGGQNLRLGAVQQILGQIKNFGGTAVASLGGLGGLGGADGGWFGGGNRSYGYTNTASSGFTGSFLLSTIFYFLMYVFILFIILLLIHFTYRPIFKFLPSDKGIIGIPGLDDKKVYWNSKTQPASGDIVPKAGMGDNLDLQAFVDNFTVSIDVLVKRLPESQEKNRVILVKAPQTASFSSDPGNNIIDYFNGKASMVIYLDTTNNLNVVFYSGTPMSPFAIRPIQNIPLNTPFRVTVVAEKKFFSVYLNGKYVFQRNVTGGFTTTGTNQKFHVPPQWNSSGSTKSIYVQNLILWPRSIQSVEVREASPALALRPDFDAGDDPDSGYCAS